MTTCSAIIGRRPSDFGFVPAVCGQSVGIRTYVTTGSLRVGYCSRDGHEASVRRRFAEQQDPEWPGDLPDYSDDMSYAKLEAPDPIDQYKGWTESEKAWGR